MSQSASPPTSPPSGAPGAHAAAAAQAAQASRRKRVLGVFFAGLALMALACTAWWFFALRHSESTDDAYVAGNVVRIMPQVSGRVLSVLADDTDAVRAGQVLLRLDTDDATLTLAQAKVALATVVRDICALQAQWRESAAQAEAARITLEQAASNLQRREVLGRENAVRVEELHNYRAQVKTNAAQWQAAKERLRALEAQLLPSQGEQSLQQHPRVQQAVVAVRQRWLDVARCEVLSPVNGQVAQRTAQPGAMVTAGTMLMAVIPLDSVWVDANFKEVQLRQMRQGQPATVRVDMHGSAVTYTGKVVGFSAGTGSAFSLIPAQNATGNWIKIVQRVPVRIELDAAQVREHPVLIGLSSLVNVDVSQGTGPLLVDMQRQRPLPEALQVQGGALDTGPVDAEIRRIIRENMLAGS